MEETSPKVESETMNVYVFQRLTAQRRNMTTGSGSRLEDRVEAVLSTQFYNSSSQGVTLVFTKKGTQKLWR